MSSPITDTGLADLGPAATNLHSLFSTLAILTGAVQTIARNIQDGIDELVAEGLNTNVGAVVQGYTNGDNNLVIMNSTRYDTDLEEENHVAELLGPLGLGDVATTIANTRANASQSDLVITHALSSYLDTLTMLPQNTREAGLRTYFRDLRDFVDQLPKDVFPREMAQHRPGTESRQAQQASPSQARPSTPPTINPTSAPPLEPEVPIRQTHPIKFLDKSYEVYLTPSAWNRLREHEGPQAAVLVHFLSKMVPETEPVLITHAPFNIIVIRDWQDEYLVVPGEIVPDDIFENIARGKLTVSDVLERELIDGSWPLTAESVSGIDIEYRQSQPAQSQPAQSQAGPASRMDKRYTPGPSPVAGPSNFPRSPFVTPSKSASQRRKSAPSLSFRAAPSDGPSPVLSPLGSRFAGQLAQISQNNQARGVREPSELVRRNVSPLASRALQRQAVLTEESILISDPRYGGMGELQRTIHARNPPRATVPGTRRPLQRSGALDQDDILLLSRGSNLQETIVAREENAQRRRQKAAAEANEKREGKKRARDDEGDEANVDRPAGPAKKQKRVAVARAANPPPAAVDTPPVAGSSSTAIPVAPIEEPLQVRRSTRLRKVAAAKPTVAPPPPPPAKKSKTAAGEGQGSRLKGKSKKGAK